MKPTKNLIICNFLRYGLLLLFVTVFFNTVYSQQKKSDLPQPKVIQPGKKSKAPSDAIILFDKGSLDNFESANDGSPAPWKVQGSKFTVVPKTTNIQTKEKFGDCQLHIEWRSPKNDVKAGKTGQGCGNSGVYFMGKYEVQVLNSYINETYPDGQAGAIYKQYPPLVNACVKPGEWQTYDIIFTAPRFSGDKQVKAGRFTVIHNGVVIQNNVEIKGATHAGNSKTSISVDELPLMLQNHSNEVSYRNIWIRKN
jgi:hypothetical protein